MNLRILSREELKTLYETELRFVFPPEELKSLASMERMMADGRYDPLVLEDGGETLGYAMMWLDRERRGALLDYLGVLRGRRNGGLGSRLLALLEERYPEIFCESEAPDAGAPGEEGLRRRRLAFYERNGFRRLGYDCAMFGVYYQALYRGPEEDDGRILEKHQRVYRDHFSAEQMERFIQLPLKEGEPVRPRLRWREEETV